MPISGKPEIGAGVSKDEESHWPSAPKTESHFYFFRRNPAMQ
jgi:hypothetical protein